MLAWEIYSLRKCGTKIIPYVLTWDGVVTKCHRSYVRLLGLPPNIESYIQTRVLKRTLETVSVDMRRSVYDGTADAGRLEKAIGKILIASFAEAKGLTITT